MGSELEIIPIQLRFPPRGVNCYLIPQLKLLIDCGPKLPNSIQTLSSKLAQHGFKLAQLEQLIITHAHLDHFGLGAQLQRSTGCRIWIQEWDLDFVRDFSQLLPEFIQSRREILTQAGVPKGLLDQVLNHWKLLWSLGESLEPEPIPAQLEMEGCKLEIIHTPGHSPGHICIKLGDQLLSGDHLIPRLSTIFWAAKLGRGLGLERYRESLMKLAGLKISQVFPGHGAAIKHLRPRIARILKHHQLRLSQLISRLDRPKTAYQLTLEWGRIPVYRIPLNVIQTLGYLEILEQESKVKAQEREGVKYFSRNP